MYSTAQKIPLSTDFLDFIGPKIFYRYYSKIIKCRKVFQPHNKMAILDLFQTIGRRPMKSEQRNNCHDCKDAHGSYDFPVRDIADDLRSHFTLQSFDIFN